MDRTAFAVAVERDREVATVRVSGELDHRTSDRLQEAFEQTLEELPAKVIVDCRKVAFIDSTGIRRLLQFARECERLEADLSVLASAQLRKVADVLGVARAVHIQPDGENP